MGVSFFPGRTSRSLAFGRHFTSCDYENVCLDGKSVNNGDLILETTVTMPDISNRYMV